MDRHITQPLPRFDIGKLSPSKVPRFGRSRPQSASKKSFRLTQAGLAPSGTRYCTNADPHAFCPRSGESAMYSMDSFTTSPIPLNCDKILRVSPCTFRAPRCHLRSLIVLLILCKTKKTQIIVIILLKKSIQPPKIRSFV